MRCVWRVAIAVGVVLLPAAGQEPGYTFDRAQQFLKTYCQACHEAGSAVAGVRLDRFAAPASLRTEAHRWSRLAIRVRNGEMPPKGSPAPDLDAREAFTGWVEAALRREACAGGMTPGPAPIRRLNRDEYTATLRDLLDIHLDVGQSLPADGAGGEGFDNAAETLFLSPLHSEKYLEAARFAMDFAAKEYKSRARILIAAPGGGISPDQAARRILEAFLPRAFRRPVEASDLEPYMALFRAAREQDPAFEPAILFALRGALVSPLFLFRAEPPNSGSEPRRLDQYALASRLSYFLWGSMPDELLFDIAAEGKLHEPAVVRAMAGRMLRNDKSLNFVQRFVEQWLRTRELTAGHEPDAQLFPEYVRDEELRSDIRLQPVLFLRELLMRDESLLHLIDSRYTIGTSNLAKFFGFEMPLNPGRRKQPQWVELPEGTNRGGLMGMPAVLTVSSYPYRTSPVLRGTWVMDAILGTPPPPPPADVPPLEEIAAGAPPKSVRERLTQHRANPVCASCHSRIDPIGFALENYDAIGRWRDEDGGKPVDNSGEMPDGRKFYGPDQLKTILMDHKDLFVRNLAAKMLGYALGRGLTLADSCTVDAIVAEVRENNYRAQSLIEAIVLSVPFQYQAGAARKE